MSTADDYLRLGRGIDCVPSIHGRATFAGEVRRRFLAARYRCVAVELPPMLKEPMLQGIRRLPTIQALVYHHHTGWRDSTDRPEEEYYVPIEPSDSISEALRLGLGERAQLAFVDLEAEPYQPPRTVLPDDYAIRGMGLAPYVRAVSQVLPLPAAGTQQDLRERWMAARLRELDARFDRVLFVCGLAHFPGIRRHFQAGATTWEAEASELNARVYDVHPDGIYFLSGEIPYLTYLYERSRRALDLSEFDKRDGLKELLLEARKEYAREWPMEAERLAPGAMQLMLKYLRNLCLVQGRFTPSLWELVVAAKGVGGGGFAAQVVELAKFYPFLDPLSPQPTLRMLPGAGVIEERGPTGEVDAHAVQLENRLPGPPVVWRNIRLERKPKLTRQRRWKSSWNPFGQCSWPEEDERIERFTHHVRARARRIMSEGEARVERFTSSLKDGLDIRETIRRWHTGDLYVRVLPPSRGEVGAVVFIFDTPTDDRPYPWRSTWYAEHANESTLCFYATDFREDFIGPGVARAFYGGALFLYPPLHVPDIWQDASFRDARTATERLALAGLVYSPHPTIAYVSATRPSPRIRRQARRLGRHIVYLPLSTFSQQKIRQLRKFHVLNGKSVRSYARDYIR